MPIHESDQAENRWNQAEWNTYELWEKLEIKQRRKRRWILGSACVVFLMISAVPVVREWTPRWQTLRAARLMAQELGMIKLEAVQLQSSIRIRRTGDQSWAVESAPDCSSPSFTPIRTAELRVPEVRWLSTEEASRSSLNTQDSYCFSPFARESEATTEAPRAHFAFASNQDAPLVRTDRIAVVSISSWDAVARFE